MLAGTFVGMAICTAGIGAVAAKGAWLRPLSIVGIILGIAILLIVGAALFDIKLPLIDSSRAALITLVVLAVAKTALTQLHVTFA